MSGLRTLIEFAERRVDRAAKSWQRLSTQRDEAKQKLLLLKQHGESYRDLMGSGLKQGMSATASIAYMGFIGQIEAVVDRQESELGILEEGCARQWEELVDARREKRMYEILSERAASREAQAQSRRGQAEIAELIQRAIKTPAKDFGSLT